MSYDCYVNFKKNNEHVVFPQKHELIGGTFALGGNDEAWLNVTFNYHKSFVKAFENDEGLNLLIGMDLKPSLELLDKAIKNLGDEPPVDDYWAATDGNAKVALVNLKSLGELALEYFPDEEMVWEISY